MSQCESHTISLLQPVSLTCVLPLPTYLSGYLTLYLSPTHTLSTHLLTKGTSLTSHTFLVNRFRKHSITRNLLSPLSTHFPPSLFVIILSLSLSYSISHYLAFTPSLFSPTHLLSLMLSLFLHLSLTLLQVIFISMLGSYHFSLTKSLSALLPTSIHAKMSFF